MFWIWTSFTYSVEEYTVGSKDMEDRLILLMSPAISCWVFTNLYFETQLFSQKIHKYIDMVEMILTGALNAG